MFFHLLTDSSVSAVNAEVMVIVGGINIGETILIDLEWL